MADIKVLAPFILSFEGGFSNHPADKGGPTNKGVTLKTWQSVGYDKNGDGKIDIQDLKLITVEDVVNRVLKPHYWDKVHGDRLKSQSVANLLADWVWGSGAKIIKNVQHIFGLKEDGIFGPITLNTINSTPSKVAYDLILEARKEFLKEIVRRDPSQRVFLNGWNRRLDYIGYGHIILNNAQGTVIFHIQ